MCKETFAVYESLPVTDGYLFSGNGIRSGAFLYDQNGSPLSYRKMIFEETAENECQVSFLSDTNTLIFTLREDSVEIRAENDFLIENVIGRQCEFVPKVIDRDPKQVTLQYQGIQYSVTLEKGTLLSENKIASRDSGVKIKFESCRDQMSI
ncbi:MAG: hypothetical protein IKP86_12760 [Anaerolineaceae bacterium]|nr:hypothetical protein [Anaerolineaceae bacterium]